MSKRYTREQIRTALGDAVVANRLSLADAQALLAAYDSRQIEGSQIMAMLGRDDDRHLLILVTFALAYLHDRPLAFRWDARRQVYIDQRGRVEPPARIRQSIDRVIQQNPPAPPPVPPTPIRPVIPTTPLPHPPLPPQDLNRQIIAWRVRMEETIAGRHIMAAAAARGGIRQMTPADRDWVRERILNQYGYLDGFEREIRDAWATGRPIPLERVTARMRMYLESARGTFEEMQRRSHMEAGFQRERSLLGVAEHCDLCVREWQRGWVPIGTLIPIGERTCLSNCKCRMEYRRIRIAVPLSARRRVA